MINRTADLLKALGEPTRLKIVKYLSVRELCICELVAILDMSQPRISQHVKVLKQTGLVSERKSRQNSYLSINEAVIKNTVIEPFRLLMQAKLEKLPELEAESQRFSQLDADEAVIACKNSHEPKGTRKLKTV